MENTRYYAFDYLKAFIIVMVVAYHVCLGYTTTAAYYFKNYLYSTAPIVDSERWIGMDFFQLFNDIFFMSLMFFIAGIFSWPSITRKGLWHYIRDRAIRLGIPFIAGVTLLTPLSQYPSFLATDNKESYLYFLHYIYFSNHWAPGPPWFLWVLLSFSVLLAFFYRIKPMIFSQISRIVEKNADYPLKIWGIFMLCVFAAYTLPYFSIPKGNYNAWISLAGPLWVQSDRILLYGLFFYAGVAVGVPGIQNSQFLNEKSKLTQPYKLWLALSLGLYLFFWLIMLPLFKTHYFDLLTQRGLYCLFFTLICVTTCTAYIALFNRFFNHYSTIFNSLAENAYAIYLIHYPIVIWLQYALLEYHWPAVTKFMLVFISSLLLSWGISYLLHILMKKD